MLAADKQLAAEIEYDLRQWEEERKRQEEETRRDAQVGSSVIVSVLYCVHIMYSYNISNA